MLDRTTVLSATDVIFGAKGEVGGGARIVKLEVEEAIP